jgi:type I restriction enzyme, S subunit
MTSDLPSSWSLRTWGQVAQLAYGKALRERTQDGTVTVFGTNGPTGRTNEKLGDGPTVVIGRKGAYRGVHYAPGPYWVIDTAFFLLPGECVDVTWAYYELLTQDINGLDSGSAIPSTRREDFYALPVRLPPLAEQRRIVKVLQALDERVARNSRLNATLDELAQVVIQRLLTRPGPSGNRAWPETSLGDVLAVLETGSRPKGGVKGIVSGVPSIGAESIVAAGVFDFAKVKYIPRDYYEGLTRGRVDGRDVLLYKDGGRPGEFEPHVSMVGEGFPFDKAAVNEHVYRMRVRSPYSQDFLYLWLRSDRLMREMRLRGTGVAVPGLNSTAVKALPIIAPDRELLVRVQDAVAPLMTLVLRNACESQTLARLRDTLLPKLISSEIRVPDTHDPEEVIGPVAEKLAVATP